MKAEAASVYERNGALEDAADSYQSAADYFHAAVSGPSVFRGPFA
jgi:hypothetical protein